MPRRGLCARAVASGADGASGPDLRTITDPRGSQTRRALCAAVAALLLAGCPAPPRISHGVALGEVTATGAVFWARADRAARMRLELAPEAGERRVHRAPAEAARDFTARVVLADLEPETRYTWQLRFERGVAGLVRGPALRGSFRTAPAPDAARALRLVWGGDLAGQNVCRDAEQGFPIFGAILDVAPDVFVGLGDMVYADGHCRATGRYGNDQVPGAFGPSAELESFWAHWRYAREDSGFQRLLARTPFVAVWDDHEVVNDAGPHDDVREEPPYRPDLHLMPLGRRAFLDYNPLPQAEQNARLYRQLRWGRHLELFVLDTRSHRDPRAAPDSPGKTMLGPAQRAWLEQALSASDATWKVVVSSVPLSIPTGSPPDAGRDGWANAGGPTGFETELLGILRVLQQRKVRNLVWITTDVHFAAAFRYAPFRDDPGFRFVEVATGPLQAGVYANDEVDPTLRPERLLWFARPRRPRTFEEALRWFNFGLLELDAHGGLQVRVLDVGGRAVFELPLQPEEASP